MRATPDIKWIKIATNVFADEKILLIEQMPDADTIIVIWFKLLCMAGKENNCGVFVMGGKIPYTEEMLATIFRRNITTVRLALKTFESFGMIEIIEDPYGNEVITIPNWEKHQNVDGMDRIREQTRQRVAKHREKQKLAIGCNDEKTDCNVTCSVTVTECNATEEEKEEEEEKEKEKKNIKKKAARYAADDDLNNAIIAFIEFRKKIKKPMTERAVELVLKKLHELSPDIATQIEIINQSILNGWQGIFPLKQEQSTYKPQPNKNRFNNFEQRSYQNTDLERMLLNSQTPKQEYEDP